MVSYPIPSVSFGSALPSARVNDIITAVNDHQTRVALLEAETTPHAVLRSNVNQTIPNGGSFSALNWQIEDRDIGGNHSTSSNTSRFAAVIPGWHSVSGTVGWATNSSGRRITRWHVNGLAVAGTEVAYAAFASSGAFPAVVTHILLAAGDFLELTVFQDSGGSLATSAASCRMTVRWVATTP